MKQTTVKRHRGVEPPREIAAAVHELVLRLGSRQASRRLGMTRETTLALAANAAVDRGTIAFARERLTSIRDPESSNDPEPGADQ